MSVPDSLKPIMHYIKIANEHKEREPAVYYWCLFYAVQTGMKIDKNSADAKKYLISLLDMLEQVKKALAGVEAVSHELIGHAHLEQYTLKLFVFADQQDRAGVFNKNVVKAFYTSGYLFDVLTTFGELDEQLQANRKYAKWKAAYIHNCLKNGETPEPGPPGGGDNEPGLDDDMANMGINSAATANNPSIHINQQPPPSAMPPSSSSVSMPLPPPPVEESNNSGGLNGEHFVRAQKYAKYAISACQYEDKTAAIENLQKALNILVTGTLE